VAKEVVFKRVLGHQKVKQILSRLITKGDFPPALLFEGPRGVGKATLAYEFVKAFFCKGQTAPCEQCSECKKVERLSHMDLHFIIPGKPRDYREELFKGGNVRGEDFPYHKEISIDWIRQVREEISKPPYEGERRFIIVLNAENLTREAQNSMLKILEEPRTPTTFILVSDAPQAVLPTIRSRSRRVRFSLLRREEFFKYPFPSELPKEFLYGISSGSIGIAKEIARREILEMRKELVELFSRSSEYEILKFLGKYLPQNSLSSIRQVLLSLIRDILLLKEGIREGILNDDLIESLEEVTLRLNPVKINQLFEKLREAEEGQKRYINEFALAVYMLSPLLEN